MKTTVNNLFIIFLLFLAQYPTEA